MKHKIHWKYFLSFIFLLFIYFSSLPVFSQEEPTLHQLERAALTYSGTDPQEIRHWKSRARWAAALPKVMVGYDKKAYTQINNTIQDSVSVSSSGVTLGPPETKLDQNDNLNRGFEVKATWDLSELIFTNNSLAISSESRYRTMVRGQVLEELHQVYFERKKILLKEEGKKIEDMSQMTRLHLEELEAKLDSLTGDYFSKMKGESHE